MTWEYVHIPPDDPVKQEDLVNARASERYDWHALAPDGAVWMRRRVKGGHRVTADGDPRVTDDGDERVVSDDD